MAEMSRRSLFKTSVLGAAATVAAGVIPAAEAKTSAKTNNYDVIVLGAGVGGLVAAVTAADAGAKVALLEKMDRPAGNAIFALGNMCAWGSKFQKSQGVEDTAEEFYKAMMATSNWRADPELTRQYTNDIGAGIDWLQERIGVPFSKVRKAPYPRLGRVCGVDGRGITGGAVVVGLLLKAAREKGVDVFFQHKAIELITDDLGAVVGVLAQAPDGKKQFFSKGGVCIATGGFSANPELTGQNIGGWAARLALRGSRYTTGENITLCRPLFAKFVNMDQFHAGPIIAETHVNPNEMLNSGYGIMVDMRGKRFMDEKNTYVMKAKGCAQLTIENRAFAIIDADCKAADRVLARFDRLNTKYGKADSIEELAKQVGLPVEAVVKSVKEYNDALAAGNLKGMNPPCSYPKPFPIAKAPFYAIPFEGGMTATFGGPLINTKAEIQNLEGRSIAGLYAAGNAAGGLFFRDYIGGAQFGGATVFGRIAGREMAARAKAAKPAK